MKHATRAVAGRFSVADEQFRLLVDGVTDYAIFMLDANGVVTTWNRGAQRIKGYTPDEIVGRHFSVFYPAEAKAAGEPDENLAAARRTGRVEREGWRLRKDGSRFWANVVIDAIYDDHGQFVGFAKVTRDRTEHRAAREALHQSEERFRLLVEGVTDHAIFMLDPEGRVTNWNTGARRINGYTSDEIVGGHFSTFYTEADRAAGLPARGLATAAREGRFESEGWRVRKDGTKFWASVVLDAIRSETGEIVGFAKITRDITERRLAADRLAKSQAALAQAQKMEAVGQLTGGIAHDFNNLLMVVINNLDMLGSLLANTLRGQESYGRARKLIDTGFRAAERGAKLTNQLLAFSRRQTLRPAVHVLPKLIGEFEAILLRAAGEGVELDLDLPTDVASVRVDAAQFEAALLNLVINARDAMPNGGRVTLSCRNVNLDGPHAEVLGLPAGPYVRVGVADTGVGMSDEVRNHALEPFYTTKEPGKGTGLGLSQVYGFITQSGGQIDIASRPGQGTTISLYLPAVAGEPEVAAVPPRARTSSSGTVLLVEDDADVLKTASEMLRDLGCEVLTACDGPAALDIVRREAAIDILFSDVVLPKSMSGVKIAQEVVQMRPEIQVILASGYPLAVLNSDHAAFRQFNFVAKPYRWTEMAEKVRHALAERRAAP